MRYPQKARTVLAVHGGPKLRPRPFPPRGHVGKEEKRAVDKLFDRAIATGNAPGYGGEVETDYCGQFAEFLGGGYADGVSSGSAGLYVALQALDIEPFSEVVVSSITDTGGFMPIALRNCVPAVADSAPGQFNVGPDEIAAVVTPRTSAIVVAHILGEPCDMPGIMKIARKHRIPVIEDCSQAHGALLNSAHLGTFGAVAVFSTMFGKHHCTGGQGGLVYTKSETLYKRVRRAADRGKPFGLPPGSTNCIAGLNFNLTEIGAAIGIAQLKKLPRLVARYRAVAAALAAGIRDLATVSAPPPIKGANPSYWRRRFEVNTDRIKCSKSDYVKALAAEGLPTDQWRLMPHTYEWYAKRRVFGSSGYPWAAPAYKGDPNRVFPCPNAHAACDRQLIVYINEGWRARDVADAVAIFKKVDAAYRQR